MLITHVHAPHKRFGKTCAPCDKCMNERGMLPNLELSWLTHGRTKTEKTYTYTRTFRIIIYLSISHFKATAVLADQYLYVFLSFTKNLSVNVSLKSGRRVFYPSARDSTLSRKIVHMYVLRQLVITNWPPQLK